MQKYETYKDSRIEWVEKIPKHWKKYRMANNGFFYKGKGVSKSQLTKDGLPVILYGDIYTKYDIYTKNIERRIPQEVAQNSVEIYGGDLLFTASGETIEEIGKGICYGGNEVAFAGGDVIIFRQSKWHSKYLSYLFNSYLFQEQKSKRSKGDIVVHVYSTQLRNIHFPIPPTKLEQTTIAKYLDHKTAEIDQLISDKKRLVELYKEEKTAIINQAVTKGINPDAPMKDSGIEWLGDVPEHWDVKRIKNICKVRQGLQIPIDKRLMIFEEGALEYITIRSINNPKDAKQYILNPAKNVICTKDDLLMARTGATGIPIIEVEGVFHNNFFLVDYNRRKVDKMYLYYFLKSSLIYEYLLLVAGTTTIPDLNHGAFYSTPFFTITKTEQIEIVKYIKEESEIIEVKISKAEKYIALLTEYRTALISEVVTGKIKVTNDL